MINGGKSWDYRAQLRGDVKYKYNLRIAEWAHGILNDFPPFDDVLNKRKLLTDSIKQIAVMEVNKAGGYGKCDNKNLLNNILKNHTFLEKQIDIINPDIIVSGLYRKELVEALFKGIQFQKSGYIRCVAKWKKYKIIDFYHPSNQNVPAASYSLLQNIFTSEVFSGL